MDISPYEQLENRPRPTPQIDLSYAELIDRQQTFPMCLKQTAAILDQPISDSSYEQIRTQTPNPCRSECNQTSQIVLDDDQSKKTTHCISSSALHDKNVRPTGVANPPVLRVYLELLDETTDSQINEYEIINEYEQIPVGTETQTTDEEQRSASGPSDRPLPLTPLFIYEPLNTNAGNPNDSDVVSRQKCIEFAKIVLKLTVIVALVATSVAITVFVLNKRDDLPGKFDCFE